MKITDETLSGVSLNTMNLYFEENQINLSQLIATRVSIELESFSQKKKIPPIHYSSLVNSRLPNQILKPARARNMPYMFQKISKLH
jgi:hypothetical protein